MSRIAEQNFTRQETDAGDASAANITVGGPEEVIESRTPTPLGMDITDVESLISASVGNATSAPAVGEQNEASRVTQTPTPIKEGARELLDERISFSVKGTNVTGKAGDKITVSPIHLVPGVVLDLTAADIVMKTDKRGKAVAVCDGKNARLIFTLGNDKMFTQVLQAGVSNLSLYENGTLNGEVGPVGFVSENGTVIISEGGFFSENIVICHAGCTMTDPEGNTVNLGKITITDEGFMADDKPVNGFTMQEGKKKEENQTEVKQVNVLSGDILDVLLELKDKGLEALQNKSFNIDELEILNSEDDDTADNIFDAFVNTLSELGLEVAGAAWANRDLYRDKKTGKLKVKDMFKGLWEGARVGMVEQVAKLGDVAEEAEKTLKSLQKLGIDEDLLNKINEKFKEFSEGATEKAADVLNVPVPEEDEEEEEKDDGLKLEIDILPGLFSVELEAVPIYSLKMGGNIDIGDTLKRFTFGVNAKGELGLELKAAAIVGNAILALTGEVGAGGKLTGGMGDGKFAQITGFTVKVVNRDKDMTLRQEGDAGLDLMVNLNLFLEGGISVGSEIIGWEKELISGKVEGTAASLLLTGKINKHGKLLSLNGWDLSNVNITTALLDQAKSKAMEMSFAKVDNIGGVEDFLEDSVGREEQLKKLDEVFSQLDSKINKTEAMIFSKDANSANKKLVGEFEKLWKQYDAMIRLSKEDVERLDNMIREYPEIADIKKSLGAIRKSKEKRDKRLSALEKYKQEKQTGLELGTTTRERVLAYYNELSGGGSGYAREDAANLKKAAQDQYYNKNAILAYESERIGAKRKVRQDRIDALEEALSKNPDMSGTEFLNVYRKVRGKGKGIEKHILEQAVSMGIVTPEVMKREMGGYEKRRIAFTKAPKLKPFVKANETKSVVTEFDQEFNLAAQKADKDMWTSFILKKCKAEDLIRYERMRNIEKKGKDKVKTDEVIAELKDIRRKYNAEVDPEKKKDLLQTGRNVFNDKRVDEEVAMGLFSPKNRYKTLTSDQLRTQIEKAGKLEDFIDRSEAGSKIETLKGSDEGLKTTELKDEDNIKIYKKYLDYVIGNNVYGSSVFSIDRIINYERTRREKAFREKTKLKHDERIEFLTSESSRIADLSIVEGEEGSQKEKENAIRMYLTGERPLGYQKKNLEIGKGKKINDNGEIRTDVDSASGYLDELKDLSLTPPDAAGMIAALRWNEENAFAATKLETASKEVSLLKGGRAKEVFNKWRKNTKKKLVSEEVLGEGLEAVTIDNYSLDDMINYLSFDAGGKHFERFSDLSDMLDAGKSEEEIKTYYKEQLKGGDRFSSYAATNADALGSGTVSPASFMEFISSDEFIAELKDRSKKHWNRIEMIEKSGTDEESVNKLVKDYTDGGAERFRTLFFEQALETGRLTPQMVMQFEKDKAEVGSRRHQARYEAVGRAESDEEARRIYESDEFLGGAGFMRSVDKNTDERIKSILNSRSGADELESIVAYENKRRTFWADLEDKLLGPVKKLEERKEKLNEIIDNATQKISAIDQNMDILKSGTKDLAQAKAAVKKADKNIDASIRTEESVREIDKAITKNKEEIKKNQQERARLVTEVNQEMKKAEDAQAASAATGELINEAV